MGKALTIKDRAQRQRTMMALRRWMERNGLTRQEVAGELDITVGHLSTLINANRTCTEEQSQRALVMMDSAYKPHPKDPAFPKGAKPLRKKEPAAKVKPAGKESPKSNKLRPMNAFETQFVVEVAKAWMGANRNASTEEMVEIVRALSVGIRT